MAAEYNPIVRTFCRLRAVLVDTLGVDRRQVHPATPLDTLIPPERLGEVLGRLRAAGLSAPELERRLLVYPLCWTVAAALPPAIIIPWLLGSWQAFLIALRLVFLLARLAFRVVRERIVRLPLLPRTVGEMVIYLIRFSDHPGYPFSRDEIALKVRFIVAQSLGVPVDRVSEKSGFIDLSAE